ncbi:MAG TPA: ABC transporter permease [Candidatus Dormibacteraeota bacterium]|nr:ABC transporter permease [Candidatus Dormibacteraeota bacterium]
MTAGRYWRSREGLAVVATLAFFLAVYLYPLTRLVAWSFFSPGFTLQHYAKLFGEPAYFRAFRNTAEISVGVTLVSLVLGYPLAYLMTAVSPRVRALLVVLVLVPFWTSVLVRTFAWMIILGRRGLINQVLTHWGLIDRPLALIYNMLGVQIGMVHVLLPFMVFPLLSVMTRIDATLVAAARSLGASPRQAFLRIFLPLSLPGVSAGCVLVFLLAVGFYITPALLGGEGQVTFTTLIELVVRDLLDWSFGASLSVFLLTVVGTLFVLFSTLLGLDRLTGQGRA